MLSGAASAWPETCHVVNPMRFVRRQEISSGNPSFALDLFQLGARVEGHSWARSACAHQGQICGPSQAVASRPSTLFNV